MQKICKKITNYNRTCWACPSQWELTLEDGSMIYARYRHGIFRATHAFDLDNAIHGNGIDLDTYDIRFSDDPMDGVMDEKVFLKILKANGYIVSKDMKDKAIKEENSFYEHSEENTEEFLNWLESISNQKESSEEVLEEN